jgi:hypothetical protein
VIGEKQINDQAIQSMAEAVRYVPGFGTTQGEGNRDSLVFRGNASTDNLFIDGMRDDVQYYRDPYNIERIEAFKGPNAMIVLPPTGIRLPPRPASHLDRNDFKRKHHFCNLLFCKDIFGDTIYCHS